jgi:hypothetical protein
MSQAERAVPGSSMVLRLVIPDADETSLTDREDSEAETHFRFEG